MNATGLAIDADGVLYVSSRHDGMVYQVRPAGNLAVYVEGMGVATGIVFDPDGNLYVGDRSGTIFKISRAAPDLRVRHARAVHRRLSSGVRAGRLSVRHRPHHLELRLRRTASRPTATWKCSIAAWAGRRAWPSTPKDNCTSPPPSAAAAAWCASRPTRKPNCSSPARHRRPGIRPVEGADPGHQQLPLSRGRRIEGRRLP